jgi:phosphatidylserine/phosphatidylglycerophosphate/cardiolipin synthase-like enzyme
MNSLSRRNWKIPLAAVLIAAFSAQPSYARKKRHTLGDEIQDRVNDVMVKTPQDAEVCFSPDEPCAVKLLRFVDSAQTSVDVAIYDLNLDQLVHHLLIASKKIQVRIVVDQRQAKGNHSLVPLLIRAGAQVRFGRQRGIMHNKFTVVDGKMIETGSFNYTNHASQSNNENQIYLRNPEVVARYKKRFEEIWSKGAPVSYSQKE